MERPKGNIRSSRVSTYHSNGCVCKKFFRQTPILASGEEGLIDMQIIDAIKTAIETGEKERIAY